MRWKSDCTLYIITSNSKLIYLLFPFKLKILSDQSSWILHDFLVVSTHCKQKQSSTQRRIKGRKRGSSSGCFWGGCSSSLSLQKRGGLPARKLVLASAIFFLDLPNSYICIKIRLSTLSFIVCRIKKERKVPRRNISSIGQEKRLHQSKGNVIWIHNGAFACIQMTWGTKYGVIVAH